MSDEPSQNICILKEAINKVVDYHIREYNITYEEMIGCFEMIKLSLWDDYNENHEDEDA